MTDLPHAYAAVAVLLAALGAVVIGSRRGVRFRMVGLVTASVAIIASYAAISDLLGRPKHAALEFSFRDVASFEVIHADLRVGEAIYVLLRIPDVDEPRLYALPWHPQVAGQLMQAMETADAEQIPLRTSNALFELDIEDRERLFYMTPIAALPPKGDQRFEPTRFEPDESNTMYGAGDTEPESDTAN